MYRGDVGDDGEVGADDGGGESEFAGHTHARLDDGKTMEPRFDAQEHQRDTDEVVKISFRDEGLPAEERGEHLLRRGLTHASRHADDATGEVSAPAGGEATECGERIVDDKLRQVVRHRTLDQGAGSALRTSGTKEIMTVAALGAHGHEDVARTEGTGVRAETRDGGAGSGGPAASGPGGKIS